MKANELSWIARKSMISTEQAKIIADAISKASISYKIKSNGESKKREGK